MMTLSNYIVITRLLLVNTVGSLNFGYIKNSITNYYCLQS